MYPPQLKPTSQERREQVAETLKQRSLTAQELTDKFDCCYQAILNDLDHLRRQRRIHVAGITEKRAFLWGFGPTPS